MPQRTTGPVILSVDQGTTNTKAVLVDQTGRVLTGAGCAVGLTTPHPGWVEQDPEEIWTSTLTAIARCLAGHPTVTPTAVTVSNQRETVVAWRRSTGRPVGPALGWQDTRTADWCGTPMIMAGDDLVRTRTGLRIDPMFSAPKIRWLLDHTDAPADDLCVGTVDSWLVHRLTAGRQHVVEAGNASRTLLLDVRALAWSADLLALFGIPAAVLPAVVGSTGPFGTCVGVPGVADGTPIIAALADSHAALYAQGCRDPGSAKATYGTGSSVMSPTTGPLPGGSPVPTTLAWSTDRPQFAREGNIVSSGAALAWATRLFGWPDVATLTRLAATVPDSDGVIMVPALAGLGAPHWDRAARASLTGLTQTSTAAHVARAVVDAVAHQICDVVDGIDADGDRPIGTLRADGGATASELLMQTQADLLGRPVAVAEVAELSAVGVALLALVAGGSPIEPVAVRRVHEPVISADARASARAAWTRAVARTRSAPPAEDSAW